VAVRIQGFAVADDRACSAGREARRWLLCQVGGPTFIGA